jgi:hypothetical protein
MQSPRGLRQKQRSEPFRSDEVVSPAVLSKIDEGRWHPEKVFHRASYEVEEATPLPCCSC